MGQCSGPSVLLTTNLAGVREEQFNGFEEVGEQGNSENYAL
jgi:hypothetical protein